LFPLLLSKDSPVRWRRHATRTQEAVHVDTREFPPRTTTDGLSTHTNGVFRSSRYLRSRSSDALPGRKPAGASGDYLVIPMPAPACDPRRRSGSSRLSGPPSAPLEPPAPWWLLAPDDALPPVPTLPAWAVTEAPTAGGRLRIQTDWRR
ncbi:hypothetical protein HK405_012565, partial [Cladochytrium tenue]